MDNSDLTGSYIKVPKKPVTTFLADEVISTDSQQSSNGEILAYLKKIDSSNQELIKRVDNLEGHSISSTPRSSKSHSIESTVPQGHHINTRGDALADLNPTATDMRQVGTGMHITHPIAGTSRTSLQDPVGGASHRNAILPGLDALRHNPIILQAVNGILASYEGRSQVKATQGRTPHENLADSIQLTLLLLSLSVDGLMRVTMVEGR